MPKLVVLKDTIFKISPEQSDQLTSSQKVSIAKGQSLDIISAELKKGHFFVRLTSSISPVGNSGYFFAGHVQVDDITNLDVPSKLVRTSKEGSKWFAEIDFGEKFFVGKRVFYRDGGFYGLNNLDAIAGKYIPDDYKSKYGFWANFIYPTACAESFGGSFTCLNTYDRARFTFGFMQYAAHVPSGDFVKFFCELLKTPLGSGYFSDLEVDAQNNIFKITNEGLKPLANAQTTIPLLNYLNPSLADVEEIEVIQSAKFIHWAIHSQQHRDIQVDCAIKNFKDAMQTYAKWYPLDGLPDKVCLIVADIHHQGRAKKAVVKEALNTDGNHQSAFNNLIKIGENSYSERIKTLKNEIKKLESSGSLGRLFYSKQLSDFV